MRTQVVAKIMALVIISAIIIVISVMLGTIQFSLREVWDGLWKNSESVLANQIIHNIRLPRVVTAFIVGANLAMAGSLLQGVLRNPLASPQVIGVNAGAGLLAVAVMIFYPGHVKLIPVGAFLGALGATMLINLLTLVVKNSATVHVILAGVAVAALLNSFTSALMFINSDELEITYLWLLGSLSGRSWSYFYMLLPYTILGTASAIIISPKLNLFHLGDEVSSSLGLHVKIYRVLAMITASILAGSAVSVAGTIGFIGLIAPHLARLMLGQDQRYIVLSAPLLGGILLVVSDTIARVLFQPIELSVGIVTSILGAPFFLFVLFKKRNLY